MTGSLKEDMRMNLRTLFVIASLAVPAASHAGIRRNVLEPVSLPVSLVEAGWPRQKREIFLGVLQTAMEKAAVNPMGEPTLKGNWVETTLLHHPLSGDGGNPVLTTVSLEAGPKVWAHQIPPPWGPSSPANAARITLESSKIKALQFCGTWLEAVLGKFKYSGDGFRRPVTLEDAAITRVDISGAVKSALPRARTPVNLCEFFRPAIQRFIWGFKAR